MVPDFVCEPCDSAHFLEDGLVAMIVEPVVVGEVAVDGVWYEIFESVAQESVGLYC